MTAFYLAKSYLLPVYEPGVLKWSHRTSLLKINGKQTCWKGYTHAHRHTYKCLSSYARNYDNPCRIVCMYLGTNTLIGKKKSISWHTHVNACLLTDGLLLECMSDDWIIFLVACLDTEFLPLFACLFPEFPPLYDRSLIFLPCMYFRSLTFPPLQASEKLSEIIVATHSLASEGFLLADAIKLRWTTCRKYFAWQLW